MNKSLEWFRSVKSLPSPPEQINNILDAIGSPSSIDYNIVEIIRATRTTKEFFYKNAPKFKK